MDETEQTEFKLQLDQQLYELTNQLTSQEHLNNDL
jgi:hypothetical protein